MTDSGTLAARQRAYFAGGATRPVAFRREQLGKLLGALEGAEKALCGAVWEDLRKSAAEAHTSEIGLVASEIRYAMKKVGRYAATERRGIPWLVWPGKGRVVVEPRGVALILGPWNYPIQLLLNPLVGAMAAGNCAVLKPSELSPRTSVVIAEMIGKAFSPEYVAVVEGGREAAEALLAERFDTIFFTGSSEVGKAVMGAAAKHLTPVTLELGGKSPCIVAADASLEVAGRRIAWGKFMNAGQTCVAPDYVLVDKRIAAELVASIRRAVREFYGDDPRTSGEYGRIVNERHFARLVGYLGEGTAAMGGEHDAGERYIAPTILTDVAKGARVMREEIFGPILPVVAVENIEEAVARAGEGETPLALYVFTQSKTVAERVIAGTRSGGACVNDVVVHMVGKDLPFGGLGASGIGAYHGKASFDCFSHRRSVLWRTVRLDSKVRYPPVKMNVERLKKVFGFLLGE